MRTLSRWAVPVAVLAFAQTAAAQQSFGPPAVQAISAASLPLPGGAATSTKQDAANTSLSTIATALNRTAPGTSDTTALPVQGVTGGVPMPVTGAFYQATQPVSGTVAVTGAYQATQPVSGTVAVTGAYQATQPVSIATMPSTPVTGAFYQTTQPISGSVNIGTAPTIAVTGAFYQTTQPVSGSVGVSNFPATQPVSIATMPTTPVTGAFYQATQPVSGTVAVTGAYQATQPVSLATLPALAVGANAIGSITNTVFGITGTLPAFAATPTVNVGTMPSVAVTGAFYQATQPVSGSVGVSNFPTTQAVSIAAMPTTPVTGTFYQATQPVSGTVAVTGAYQATQPVSIATMPTTAVTGTFYQATQPISGSVGVSNFPATQAVSIATMPSTPVTGAFYQTTQPMSATSLPLPAGAATSALQSSTLTALGSPLQAGGNVVVTGLPSLPAFAATPTFKVADTAGSGITSTLVASKQRLDVTLAAGGAPGATASTIADQVGGVDGGGLLRAILVDTAGRVMVGGVVADGSAPTGNSIHISGVDGGGLKRTIRTDTTGNVQVGIVSPAASARNFPGCTVGIASGTCLAASTAVNYLQVQNTSPTASVACAFGATAVLNSSGSFQLAPGQSAAWGPNTYGVPTGALTCISSAASTPLFVEWK